MQELQSSAWTNGVLPHVARISEEWTAFDGVDEMPALGAGVVAFSPFTPDPRYAECDKERLVNLFLGSHEFLLLVHRVVGGRRSWCGTRSTRCSTSSGRCGARRCCRGCASIKGRWMNITSNDVAAFMKDIQIDATSLPGKAFELIFEMPEADVGIMTFNKCCVARPVGSARPARHPREELSLDVSRRR